jgi:hypothetical protein
MFNPAGVREQPGPFDDVDEEPSAITSYERPLPQATTMPEQGPRMASVY